MRQLRSWLIAGLLVWLPVIATIIVIRFIINLMDWTLVLLPAAWRPENLFGIYIPGLGLILAIVVLLGTGMALTNIAGRRLVNYWEALLARIPLVRSIYSGVKKVSETLLMPSGKSFRRVLLVEYPRKGIWSLGFQTSSDLGEVQEKTGKHVLGVFVPTTPNPTSGFIVLVPADEVVELDMTVDEAIRMIISLGVVVPEWPRPPDAPLAPPVDRT
ncbi:MAG: DUF502 domain-containing protein [Xanthomonadaceae bacterium]|nr:DUF502 domain-containing protein [Xanthomonadaceae bacterium]